MSARFGRQSPRGEPTFGATLVAIRLIASQQIEPKFGPNERAEIQWAEEPQILVACCSAFGARWEHKMATRTRNFGTGSAIDFPFGGQDGEKTR